MPELPPFIADHEQRAVDELTDRLKRPRIVGLARVLGSMVQECEVDAYGAIVARRLDVAVGRLLDVCGRIVGEPRGGLPDSVYRLFIKAKIQANASQGEIPRILRVTAILADSDDVRYFPAYPAGYRLAYVVRSKTSAGHRSRLRGRVLDMTAAGVAVESIVEGRTGYFGFAGNPNSRGFNVGRFGELI